MLSVLISMFGGGLMRMLPEVFHLFTKRTDNAHELAMLEKQFQLETTRNAQKYTHETTRDAGRAAAVQADNIHAETLAMIDAQREALSAQVQKIGIKWVDALNFSVRPVTTYFFLSLYGLVKLSALVSALLGAADWLGRLAAVRGCWDANDLEILAGILAFWFVGRVFDKRQK